MVAKVFYANRRTDWQTRRSYSGFSQFCEGT